jgi:DNA-binding transcriptional MerR regulator
MGVSGSITTGIIGLSGGKHYTDENCERIKLAKVLQDFGMKVASVAVLCQDPRVHAAMESAGTPCPWFGKIGKEAQAMWDKYPEMRPDHEEWEKKNQIMAKVDDRIAEEARIAAEEERLMEEARLAEVERLKKLEEIKNKPRVEDKIPIAIHD